VSIPLMEVENYANAVFDNNY